MATPKTLRIFFSSPGDVKMERETARNIVRRLQGEVGDAIRIEPYFWEHEVMSATMDYQQNIPEMDRFDVVVCMLWSRLGTPLHPGRHPRPDGGFFESGTEYEFYSAMSAFREHGTPNIFVFRNNTEPRRPSRPKEAREAADREIDRLDQFFERYFKDGNYFTAAVNEYRTLGEFEDKLSLGLRSYVLEHVPTPTAHARTVARYDGRPYLGLAAFGFEDAQVFFGRTAQVGAVVEALQTQEMEAAATAAAARRFVMILGSSGCGKSSLARAGILPMLVRPGVIEGAQAWRRCVFKPGDAPGDPLLALATALLAADALPELANDGATAGDLADMMRMQPAGAGLLVRQALGQAAAVERVRQEAALRDEISSLEAAARTEDAALARERLANLAQPVIRLALVADQLEELFTGDLTADAVAAGVAALHSLATNGRIHVIATLRSDFYPSCLEHPLLVGLMNGTGSYALTPANPGDIAQMIRQPAATAGLVFEENTSTGDKLDEVIRDAAMRDPSALPLLSYTLEQLHDRRRPDGTLTFSAYADLGGLEGAIGCRAEDTFQALPAVEQAAFDEVWKGLITLGRDQTPVRRRVAAGDLPAHGPVKSHVDAFVSARLLTAEQGADGRGTVSVAHEALLRHWPRLVSWLERNLDFLRVRARIGERFSEWEEHRNADAYLIPGGPALAEAEQLLAGHGQALGLEEKRYIKSSIERARAHDRAKLKSARRTAVGALLLTLVAAVGGVVAWIERGQARGHEQQALRQKSAAEQATELARANQVRASYLQGIDRLDAGQTREGITSLLQAYKTDPGNAAVARRLYSYLLYGLPKAIPIRSAEAPEISRQRISGARDGENQRCVYLTRDHTVEAYDLNERKVIHGAWENEPDSFAALMSYHNQFVMNIRQDYTCRIWHTDTPDVTQTVALDKNFSTLSVSFDGKTILEGMPDGTVNLIDATTGKPRHVFKQKGHINTITGDCTNTWYAVAGDELVFYNLQEMRAVKTQSLDDKIARDVQFSNDHQVAVARFIAADQSGPSLFAFFDVHTGKVFSARTIEVQGEVFDYGVNHDGTAIIVANFANSAKLYHREDSGNDRSYPLETFAVKVAFSPDDLLVFTADSEGTVRIFDADTGSADSPARLAFEPISHEGRIVELHVSWDGQYLLTSTNTRARVWDLAVGRALTQPVSNKGETFATVLTPDDGKLLVAGDWGIGRYDARSLARMPDAESAGTGTWKDIIIGASGKSALARKDERVVQVIDPDHPENAKVSYTSPEPVEQLALGPDESTFAVLTRQGVTIVDARTGKPGATVPKAADGIARMLYAGDSAAVVLLQNKEVRLIPVKGGSGSLLPHRDVMFLLNAFAAGGRYLAASAVGTGIKTEFVTFIWDLASPASPPMELGHDDMVYVLGFNADASQLITGTRDQLAQVWDRASGAKLGPPLVHHDNPVSKALFSHDGQWVATVSTASGDDDIIRVWDWHNAALVSEPIHAEGRVKSIAFSSDDRMLLATSPSDRDGRLILTRLWELAPSGTRPVNLASLAEATVGRVLTDQGGYAQIDPFTGWERLRKEMPDSWFLQNPARRSVSPNISAAGMDWLRNNDVPVSQALRAMPAVGVVRSAVAYWENNALNARLAKWEKLDPKSGEAETELKLMRETYRKLQQIRQLAERNAARDADVCYFLALSGKSDKDFSGARKWVLQGLRLEPGREALWSLANEVLYLKEDPGLLATVLDKWLNIHGKEPGQSNALARRGYLHHDRGDAASATPLFTQALAAPGVSLEDKVIILDLLNRHGEAIGVLDDTDAAGRKSDPAYQPTQNMLLYRCFTLELAGRREEAIVQYLALHKARGRTLGEKTLNQFDYPAAVLKAIHTLEEAALKAHPELGPDKG